ncbi:MAG: hypothetical protein Q4F28_03185 [Eubacteriales bacterium]|nr:hypothetical protein [Eubacteriales bacterium]
MIELKPIIKNALLKIDFIKRYEQISALYDAKRTPSGERLRYFDGEIIIDSIAQLGYKITFEPKEKYFRMKEVQLKEYTFGANIILDNGMVDIVWIVKKDNELLLGLPIGEYSRLMVNVDYRIKKPIFGTYEDLDDIVCRIFAIFEDFKLELLKAIPTTRTEMS